jgi:hypothetical protein
MPALPDRVTALTCIGCAAMGRQERCEGSASRGTAPKLRCASEPAAM